MAGMSGIRGPEKGMDYRSLSTRMIYGTGCRIWIQTLLLLTLFCSKAELLNRNSQNGGRQGDSYRRDYFNTGSVQSDSPATGPVYNRGGYTRYTQGRSQEKEIQGDSQPPPGDKKPTTFLVPRSDSIQIAFTDGGGREIQQSLHTDLLKLYKSVMEQLLERDQFIQTVKSFMEKTEVLDSLTERVRRLELHLERLTRGQQGQFNAPNHGGSNFVSQRPDSTGSRTDERDGNLARKVRRQQEDISRMQEEQVNMNKRMQEQSLEFTRQRDFTNKLQQTVTKMDLEISRNKQMTIAQAELLDHHANKMETQRTATEVIDAKFGTISSKVQWHDFRLGMMENTTSRLNDDYVAMQMSFGEFHTTQRKIYGLVEKLQTDTERCHVNVATAKMKVRFLQQDVDKILSIVERLTPANISYKGLAGKESMPMRNLSLAGSVRIEIQEMIDRTATPLLQGWNYLNMSTHRLERHQQRQLNQLDKVAEDMSRAGEENRRQRGEITNIANELDIVRVDVEELHEERQDVRLKINELERQMRDRKDANGGYSPTTVGHQRRTTRSLHDHSPVAMESTLSPGATHGNLPEWLPGVGVTDSGVREGGKPYTENEVENNKVEPSPKSPRRAKWMRYLSDEGYCSIIEGFGPGYTIRSFPRIFTGAWMKDPLRPHDPRIFVLRNNFKVNNIREYANEAALAANNVTTVHHMPHRCTGTGHVVYNGHVYCNKYQSNRIMKYNIKTGKVKTERLRNAAWNNTYPYSSGAYSDIDLAIDETGLWAIYSTKQHQGKIVIAKLSPDDMTERQTWVTDFIKTDAANAFMSCGRLYVTIHSRGKPHSVGYIYDTTMGQEVALKPRQITFGQLVVDTQASLDYNPVEKRLYAWILSPNWDGLLVSYEVLFQS